jgi:hypothetical protein
MGPQSLKKNDDDENTQWPPAPSEDDDLRVPEKPRAIWGAVFVCLFVAAIVLYVLGWLLLRGPQHG